MRTITEDDSDYFRGKRKNRQTVVCGIWKGIDRYD